MFTLPTLDEIDVAVKKENHLLKGAQFLDFSSQLSPTAHQEVQEEINFASKRIQLYGSLKSAIEALLLDGFPERPVQIASPEIIQEFKDLIADASLVVADFKSPIEVEIISTENV